MHLDELRDELASYPGATFGYPFGPDVLVFKVVGKVFALVAEDERPVRVTLKCDPDLALELRDEFESIRPGYHMNKQHWNTIALDGTVPDEDLYDLMSHSYDQVVAALPRARRQEIIDQA